ncbi:Oidioi.mRNA.OKI2018_I69.chr2.g5399.t1.cds [Oikopleura dioica]|uniref:Oidioi.mRNA.OKI2018_I69.chr2.g5399.t1.cds n=1 Tax=Oikopleura dioica TaxID=34765 RepID=A0ABN7T9D9_OIKDI|nr:Oidioi.mRNA.OKI2018_I69.chr2.g5399.t1.cds [Oikopleura dioica]
MPIYEEKYNIHVLIYDLGVNNCLSNDSLVGYQTENIKNGRTELRLTTRSFDPEKFGIFEILADPSITQIEMIPKALRLVNIFEAVALVKYKTSNENMAEKIEELIKSFGMSIIGEEDLIKFRDHFEIGLEIWSRTNQGNQIGRQISRVKLFTLLGSPMIKLEMIGQTLYFNKETRMTLINGKFNTHSCPIKNCAFETTQRWGFRRHVDTCRGESVTVHKQKVYGNVVDEDVEFLKTSGFIPDRHKTRFIAFDIESNNMKEGYDQQSKIIGHFELLSIGIVTTQNKELFIKRKGDEHDDLTDLIGQFWAALKHCQRKIEETLPDEIIRGKEFVLEKLADTTNMDVKEKSSWKRRLRILESYSNLTVYSWYGEKFDHNCIIGPLVEYLASHYEEDFNSHDVIQRGRGYMLLRFGKIVFKDFFNFSSGKLEEFAASVGVKDLSKMTYPYELFQSATEPELWTTFPDYTLFRSSTYMPSDKFVNEANMKIEELSKIPNIRPLNVFAKLLQIPRDLLLPFWNAAEKKFCKSDEAQMFFHTSIDKYTASREYFDDKCKSMVDFLKEYNLLDCRLLLKSINAYAEGFLQEYGIDIHKKLSLPGLAQQIAFDKYDPDCQNIYSIPVPELKNDVRKHLNGGICCVQHRLLAINSEDQTLPEAARRAPNGKKIMFIDQQDMNSLYPFTLQNDLPTGPGFHLKKIRKKFKLFSMDRTQTHVSVESIQWLEFFAHSTGLNVIHAFNKGEKKIGTYFLDGYAVKNGQAIGLDYNGCRYHRCPNPECKVERPMQKESEKRLQFLTSDESGLDLYLTISGCQWAAQLSTLRELGYEFPRNWSKLQI